MQSWMTLCSISIKARGGAQAPLNHDPGPKSGKQKEDITMMDPREVLSLSSGTISVLTGTSPNYAEIDKIQFEFYNWIVDQKREFENWVEAWNEFKGRN